MLKKLKGTILSVIALGAMGLILIAGSAGCSSESKVQADSKTYGDKDNGTAISLKVNGTFQIRLEANATTGYSWNPAKDTNFEILAMEASQYEPDSTDKEIAGGGGYALFNFKALKKGQTDLVLEYQRTWETGVEPAKTFKISVTVK